MARSSIGKPFTVWKECIAGIAHRADEIVVCMNEAYVVLPLGMTDCQQSLVTVLKKNHVKKVFTAGRKLFKFFVQKYPSLMDVFDFVCDESYERLRYPCRLCGVTECPTVRAYWVWRTHTKQIKFDEKVLFDSSLDEYELESLSMAIDAVKIDVVDSTDAKIESWANAVDSERCNEDKAERGLGHSKEFECGFAHSSGDAIRRHTENGCPGGEPFCAQTEHVEDDIYVSALEHFKLETGIERNTVWTFERRAYTTAVAADEEVCVVCTDSAFITIPWNVKGWEEILCDVLYKDNTRIHVAGARLGHFLRKGVKRELLAEPTHDKSKRPCEVLEELSYDKLKRPCKMHGLRRCPWMLAFFLWKRYAARKPSLYRDMYNTRHL